MPNQTLSNEQGRGRGSHGLGRFVRRMEIAQRTTLSLPLLHTLIKTGQFPRYVKLGPRVAGLPEDVLDAWLESRMDARAKMRGLWDLVELPPWEPCMPSGKHPAGIQILERWEVLELLGVGPNTLYAWVHKAQSPFPGPVPLSERRRGWASHEVVDWIRERAAPVLEVRRETIGDLVRRQLADGPTEDSTRRRRNT